MDETLETLDTEDDSRRLLLDEHPEPVSASESEPEPEPLLDTNTASGAALAGIAIGVYFVMLGIKQALHRLDWLEHPRSLTVLRKLPTILGAVFGHLWFSTSAQDLGWITVAGVALPGFVFGGVAGYYSDVIYIYVRERFPLLDAVTLTSHGKVRAAALVSRVRGSTTR